MRASKGESVWGEGVAAIVVERWTVQEDTEKEVNRRTGWRRRQSKSTTTVEDDDGSPSREAM